jgi:hypothetical protein
MASTFSTLKFELIGTGEQDGTWGDTTNTNLGTAIEQAITGSGDITFASADVTLTLANTNSAQVARNLRLVCTGVSGGARQLIVPSIEKQYIVQNDLSDTVTIRTSAGTGIAVLAGKTMTVFNNGTDVVDVTTQTTSLVTGSITASSLSLTSALPVTSGGTGLATLTANNVILGNGTSNPSFVAPGNSANVLTSNGTTWVSSVVPQPEFFSSGTRMTFNQTAAPTGWTKDTSTDNAGFRLVSGNVSSGGSVDFTVAFSSSRAVTVTSMSGSAGATTLSTPQIPSHTHTINVVSGCGGIQGIAFTQSGSTPLNTGATGGGGSHTHPFSFSTGAGNVNLEVKYVDLIIAQKD